MDITQQIDQMSAMLRDISPMLWTYYADLKKQGFDDKQAFALVRDYQNITFKGGASCLFPYSCGQ